MALTKAQQIETTLLKPVEWFIGTPVWRKFAQNVMGKFTFRFTGYPSLPMVSYFRIKEIIAAEPDKLFVFTAADVESLAWKVQHKISGAYWGHAGFVEIGKDGELYARHMKGDGLGYWHLLDLLKECDHFAMLELPISEANLSKAKKRLKTVQEALKVEYNYRFEMAEGVTDYLDSDKPMLEPGALPFNLYCSEFIYVVGKDLVEDPDFKPGWTLTRSSFEPDDVYRGGTVRFEA